MLEKLSRYLPWLAVELAMRAFTTPKRIARPAWEKEIVANGEPLRVACLSATSWGEDARPIVLLVHGWEGRGSQLSLLVAPLLAAGFRVVALDGPAHGDSPGRRTNVYSFSRFLLKVATELGGLHAVVAHSFGGGASAIALADGLEARGAVLVAAPSDLRWVIDGFCKHVGFSSQVAARFRARLSRWAGVSADDIDIARLKVRVPTLIVHDRGDREVPFAEAERIVQHWPTAKLLALTGAGHRRVLKAPEFLKAVTEFLSELPRSAN